MVVRRENLIAEERVLTRLTPLSVKGGKKDRHGGLDLGGFIRQLVSRSSSSSSSTSITSRDAVYDRIGETAFPEDKL